MGRVAAMWFRRMSARRCACVCGRPLRERVPDMGAVRLALEGAFETAAPQTSGPVIDAQRAAGLDGGTRRRGVGDDRARHSRRAAFARSTAAYAARDAHRDQSRPLPTNPPRLRSRPTAGRSSFRRRVTARSRLWLRSLATTTAQPLAGTEGARCPFWSPDSRAIGFFAGGALKRLDLGGGAPQTLAPAISGTRRDVDRGRRHRVCAEPHDAPDARVRHRGRRDSGDDARAAAGGPRGAALSARRPPVSVLPFGAPDTAGIYLGALDMSAPTRLTPADSGGVYLPTGWLLWVRAGTLVAQRLDVAQAALTGEPVTLADAVAVDATFSRSAVSVAATGLVAYRTGAGSQSQLTWFDRSGTARGTVGDPDATLLQSSRVTRRPSRGREPHGAGQHRPLAAGRRPHEPPHVRCG